MGLKYIENSELRKLRRRPEILAHALRMNALYMVALAGKGHLGTSLSSMEIIVAVWEQMGKNDLFISSKGHDAVAQYAMLIYQDLLPQKAIHTFRLENGLPGHPTIDVPGINANTGSLGMGLSKALGFAKFYDTVYVLLGDGEMMEGQNWEAALAAINTKANNIIAIVDVNGFSQDGKTALASDQIERMFIGASWGVQVVRHGQNYHEIASILNSAKELQHAGPWAVIVNTTKGAGISEFADSVESHFGPPDDYEKAFQEIDNLIPNSIKYVDTEIPPMSIAHPAKKPLELAIPAIMDYDPDVVVVGADTLVDHGLGSLKDMYPDRVFDFGIAEQNAVSFASALALEGKKPIVITYACFLRRAFEQIYNQVTEGTKVIYIGTMTGTLPASGPGISHQSLDDGVYMNYWTTVYPTEADQVYNNLVKALKAEGSAYLRMK